jgi:hypothetical protein
VVTRPAAANLGEKPKEHASYRVRPRDSNPALQRPIRFTAPDDDRARFIYRHAESTLVAQGLPVMPLVLERCESSLLDVWVEVQERLE